MNRYLINGEEIKVNSKQKFFFWNFISKCLKEIREKNKVSFFVTNQRLLGDARPRRGTLFTVILKRRGALET